MTLPATPKQSLEGAVMRDLCGAAGPGERVGPRRLSGAVVRPLNFAVRAHES